MAETNTSQNIQFSLERIYVKDISYEAPAAPGIFAQQVTPQIGLQLGVEYAPVNQAEGTYEVVLTLNVKANQEGRSVFLIEIQQAGLFRVVGATDEILAKTLNISGGYILLPFAREAVNDLVTRGGFPQLLINPINFEALYEQQQAAKQKQQVQH